MTTTNLGLPLIEAAQAQKHVTHNEALRLLDTLVQLAVLDRDLNAPPGAPEEGERWIVKADPAPTGAWAGHGDQIAAWQDGGWQFSTPGTGWIAYVVDESTLVAWNGSAWTDFSIATTLQNLVRLGVGTTADATNPLAAKLNNALWTAKTVAEGGDGDLRYKMSKESAASTLSLLMQDNFSGRAEIGLAGDDDLHIKVSPDGTNWIEALLFDRTSGAAKVGAGLFLTGVISPAEIDSDQDDYNPAGLAGAAVLRLSTDDARSLTGLSGGGAGRVVTLYNVGAESLRLANENGASSAANRFAFGCDAVLQPNQSATLWYDATSQRWRLQAGRKFPVGLFHADRGGTNQTGGTANAQNKLQANNEVVDVNGWYDAATNYRYTPQEPGYYLFYGSVNINMNGVGQNGQTSQAQIMKNGSATASLAGFFANSGLGSVGSTVVNVAGVLPMNGSTDYAEFYAWLPTGITTINGPVSVTNWGGFKIADL